MFYIREIYFRLLYLLYLIIFLFFIYYKYKEITFKILLIPSQVLNITIAEHFIYTQPTELLYTILNLNFFFITVILVPYVFWLILDFLKTGLLKYEYNTINKFLKFFIFSTFFINFVLFSLTVPSIFSFFKSFNTLNIYDIDVKFELKIVEFINFIYNIFYIINICILFLFLLYTIIILKGLFYLIKNKKVFILINIFLAIICSTPEISSLIIIFLILNILLETIQFILSFFSKFNKVTYLKK